jgi:cell division transport system permease protein
MFILPLLAVLISIQFVIVFNRITHSYEDKLKSTYSILVTSKKDLTTSYLRTITDKVDSVVALDDNYIAQKVSRGVDPTSAKEIIKELPHFYRVYLTNYFSLKELREIEQKLKGINGVLKVNIYAERYKNRDAMFTLIKNSLNIFVVILFIVSLLLIIKQMEVWQLAHKERMQIMEIFGAPLMLRSGVLFKMAIIDAIIATLLNLTIFLYLQTKTVSLTGLQFLEKKNVLFQVSDLFVWILASLVIVVISVLFVAFKSSEVIEQ